MPNDSETAATAEKTQPKKRRRLLMAAAILLATLAIAVVLLPYLVPTAWIASVAEKGITSGINREATLGEISWGWFSGVTVKDVTLDDTSEFGGGRFLDIGSVSLKIDLVELLWSLGKKVTVKSLAVHSPRVTVIRTADGRYNIETLALSPRAAPAAPTVAYAVIAGGGPSAVEIAISRVKVTDGTLIFKDLGTGARVEVAALDALIDADFSKPLVSGSADLSLEVVQAEGNAVVTVAAESFAVDRKASTDVFETAAAAGTLKIAGIELSQVLAALGGPSAGFASGKFSIGVDYKLEKGEIQLAANDGRVAALKLGATASGADPVEVGDISLSFHAHGSADDLPASLVLDSLEVAAPFARITASAASLDPDALSLSVNGSIEPARVPKALLTMPEDMTFSGSADFTGGVDFRERPMTFSASADAGALALSSPTMAKAAGTPAALALSGRLTREPLVVVFEDISVSLAGGSITGKAEFDAPSQVASWNVSATFDGVDLDKYVKTQEPLRVAGGFTNSGRFPLAEHERMSDFVLDTTFADLTLDLPSRQGTELSLDGAASVTSVRANVSDFVIAIGGSPLTVNASIREPLAKPAGTITVRGRSVDFDNITAVAAALSEATGGEKAEDPAGPTSPQGAPEEQGFFAQLTDIYLNNANVEIDLRVDETKLGDYAGENLAVNTGLVAGKLLVRQASLEIFGGRMALDSVVELAGEEKPTEVSLKLLSLRAGEPAKELLSKIAYGVDFSGVMDLSFRASGTVSGGTEEIAKSFTGDGSFTVTDGVLSLPGLARALSQFASEVDLSQQLFSKLNGTLALQDGILKSRGEIPRGDGLFILDGRVSYTGDNSQVVSVIPEKLGSRIRLVTVENGQVRYEALPEDLLKAGILDIIRDELSGDDDEKSDGEESDTDKALKILGDILSNLQKE